MKRSRLTAAHKHFKLVGVERSAEHVSKARILDLRLRHQMSKFVGRKQARIAGRIVALADESFGASGHQVQKFRKSEAQKFLRGFNGLGISGINGPHKRGEQIRARTFRASW